MLEKTEKTEKTEKVKKIVIFDPPGDFGDMIKFLLRFNGYESKICLNIPDLRQRVEENDVDILIVNREEGSKKFRFYFSGMDQDQKRRIRFIILHADKEAFNVNDPLITCSQHFKPIMAPLIIKDVEQFLKS